MGKIKEHERKKYLMAGNDISNKVLDKIKEIIAIEKFDAGVILCQNCIQLTNTTLDDLFFFKNFFYQKQCKYAINIRAAHIKGAFL